MMRVLVLLGLLVAWTQIVDAKKVGYLEAKVVKIEIAGSSQMMTTVTGSDAGITKEWTAKIVVGSREIADATIVRVDKRQTIVKTSVTFDQMPREILVRFYPPPQKR